MALPSLSASLLLCVVLFPDMASLGLRKMLPSALSEEPISSLCQCHMQLEICRSLYTVSPRHNRARAASDSSGDRAAQWWLAGRG